MSPSLSCLERVNPRDTIKKNKNIYSTTFFVAVEPMAHGHEENADSWLKRILFWTSLTITIYALIELVQVWPQNNDNSDNSKLDTLDQKVLKLDTSVTSLKSFLHGLDQWYETEINVDHHDDTGHGDEHGSHEENDADHGTIEPKVNVPSGDQLDGVKESIVDEAIVSTVASRGDIVSIDDDGGRVLVSASIPDPFSDVWTSEASNENKLPLEGLSSTAVPTIEPPTGTSSHDDDDDIFSNMSDDDLNELLNLYVE